MLQHVANLEYNIMKNTRIKFACKSWKGKRPINQDALACSFNKDGDFCAVVCDGLGSVAGSEHASKLVSNVFADAFIKTKNLEKPTPWFKETLRLALNELNNYVIAHNCRPIATTIALLLVIGKKFYSYNIGDTRVFMIKPNDEKKEIKQYSYDHNYKNYLISEEVSEEAFMAAKPKWHSLTNYIDASNPKVAKFDTNSGEINGKTFFLVCTDGLYGYVLDNQKYDIITKLYYPTPLKSSLLNKTAYANGSDDNISGILVTVK